MANGSYGWCSPRAIRKAWSLLCWRLNRRVDLKQNNSRVKDPKRNNNSGHTCFSANTFTRETLPVPLLDGFGIALVFFVNFYWLPNEHLFYETFKHSVSGICGRINVREKE
jgi:hypothetical protein